ncbi:D-tagatose-bisphosphate aldolase, class II, non-catalytic subunit [Actinoplanes sp. NBRC 103695]|uniref:D-tagatose-bisphosphate aldolase, class II, non-catalytic subunit n=1 Tax=Actinoplanes sp. NBRC 103695 TaxID=3032202 RepID=UPI0024A23407|nr:D-tagatose-bisphosphate aldolase, class II, non-catalytic subunit [Actinoplanes sp. NBRC 103695]GLY94040.1 tagatose-6-phosphate kinase [Actinoplanes sp. NBRC 103695]
MSDAFDDILSRHRGGQAVGITSVCSANPLVLQAACEQAVADDTAVLIEATSNQVDQFGGYTGMRPADFRDLVHGIADRAGLSRERVVLGGDHLGPNVWRSLPADEAMSRADDLVAAYVEAGYTKIHLDCTMACADDRDPLTDEEVAGRAARLARVAEQSARTTFGRSDLRYVVGTEVPVPGGAHEEIDALTPTSPEAARATIEAHRAAFAGAGLDEAWTRVVALVVQPGVEFDALRVVDYDRGRARALSHMIEGGQLVFEAHSTDYQTSANLTALVQDHWAILKVGPGLTFALREALFALAAIEAELVPAGEASRLPDVVDEVMVREPKWWNGYYEGDEATRRLARRYSYSDRMRYYWPDDRVSDAVDRLIGNLRAYPPPPSLISAHLPEQYARVRAGVLEPDPIALAVDHVRDVLRLYSTACNPEPARSLP